MQHGRVAGLALLASMLIPTAAPALEAETSATLRCLYKRSDNAAVEPLNLDIKHAVRGQWQHGSQRKWNNLFYTDASPDAVRKLCDEASGNKRPTHVLADIAAVGTIGGTPHGYEIWHRGQLNAGKPIERIVSFGDSLTDKGNMYTASTATVAASTLPSSSWFVGRFSNGPTWVEHLAKRNGLTLNSWAVGGAQTRDKKLAPLPGLPSIQGIDQQIERFFEHARQLPSYDPSRTLFTFLVAGNDFVNDTKTGPEIIAQQEASLKRLTAAGARKIIVVNLPDVSVAPVFRLGRNDAHTVLGKVEYYNAHIGDAARRVAAATGAEIRVIDVRSSFDAVLAKKEKYGFTNVTQTCLAIDKDSPTTYFGTPKQRAECQPDRYVFWDTLHPTTRMHELMAGWVVESAPPGWGLK